MGSLYLWLDLISIAFPLISSFESRIAYFRKWYALFPAIIIVGIPFVIWDVIFTRNEIWGFNEIHLIGVEFADLPIEEWLFFLFIPFSCMFIYEAVNYLIPSRPLKSIVRPFSWGLGATLLLLGLLNIGKLYTSLTFISTGIFLILFLVWNKREILDRMWLGYLFSLLPFLIVNGILTGSFLDEPVVWYNNMENLGIRIFTIPIEDSIYLMLMLFPSMWIYESILKRY